MISAWLFRFNKELYLPLKLVTDTTLKNLGDDMQRRWSYVGLLLGQSHRHLYMQYCSALQS